MPLLMQGTQEMQVLSLGQKDSLEESMATHSCFLAWKIQWTEEPGGVMPDVRIPEREERRLPRQCNWQKGEVYY